MKISHHFEAEREARSYKDFNTIKTIIIEESGSAHINCDVDTVVKELKKLKINHFIVKGEVSKKKDE